MPGTGVDAFGLQAETECDLSGKPAINSPNHAFWHLAKKRGSDGGLHIPPMGIIMFWLFVLTIATITESTEEFSCFQVPVQAPHRVID
jgi:hypothetical protein